MEPDELEGLVDQMTPEQALHFKKAVVRQAIHYVTRQLPPEEEDDGHRTGIRTAIDWLNDPTEERAHAATMYGVSECWDGGVRYHDYPLSFLDPLWAAGEKDPYRAASYIIISAPEDERKALRNWQQESARAILREDEPPPLE